MTYTTYKNHRRRGQSLILALVIMFILFFVGAVFVALVARNLVNSGDAKNRVGAGEFAQAGIKHAAYFLQFSPEGADWRPAPEDPNYLASAVGLRDPDRKWLLDGYTRIDFGQGRALIRVSYQPGYVQDPQNPAQQILNPNGKYVKIESVGRVGLLDRNDPTSFLNVPAPRLRRELIAYKAIGITDYLRFVTNKSNDSKAEASIGPPPIGVPTAAAGTNPLSMQYGKLQVRAFSAGGQFLLTPGAPMRFNCNLKLMGNLNLQADRRNGEQILVAGTINRDPDPLVTETFFDPATGVGGAIINSNDPNFLSFGGLLRDAGANPDAKGYARNISKLDPPLIDEKDPATSRTRYRTLTRDSGRWIGAGPNAFNTGRFGLGAGLFINNEGNTERETLNVVGGRSLRSILMQPGSAPYWNGPFYTPPGVFIEFGYPVVQRRDASGNLLAGQFAAIPGFRVIRDPSDRPFRDPNGNIAPSEMDFTFFIFKPANQKPVLKLDNEFFRSYMRTSLLMTEPAIDAFLPSFNGVIYAEGNARVRGLLPGKTNIQIRRQAGDNDGFNDAQLRDICDPPSITVATGGNIYVEGSLVREPYTYTTVTNPAGIPMTVAGASLALLAQENVIVNPTLFVGPNKAMGFGTTNLNEEAPFHTTITVSEPNSTPPFALEFMFGDDPTGYTTTGNQPMRTTLLVRHAAPAESTFLNLYINEAFPQPPSPLYLFAVPNAPPAPALPPEIYPLADIEHPVPNPDCAVRPPLTQLAPVFEQREFTLLPRPNASNYLFFNTPGYRNTIRPAVDPNYTRGGGVQDYLFARGAVVPMDVRIEAVMYAQNGSFFVIPGYSFNPDTSDTRDAALRRATLAGLPAGTMLRPQGTSDYYPFYNEPLDVRITIVGTVAENRTASIADQSAWMQLWGYINEVHGSTGVCPPNPDPTMEQRIPDQHIRVSEVGMGLPPDPRTVAEQNARITRGLRFIYDPFLHAPFRGYDPNAYNASQLDKVTGTGGWSNFVGGAVRQDDYGRTLPPIPRLPVCPGFVFYGEVR